MSIDPTAQSAHVFPSGDHLSAQIGWEVPQANAKAKDIGMFAEEEPSFWDVLDVINPLQHIPVVNTLYRELTGDEIGVGARLAGGALFGGPIGFAVAAVNAAIEQESGKDIGGHMLAMFSDDEPTAPAAPPASEVAAAGAPAAAPPDTDTGPQAAVVVPDFAGVAPPPRDGMMFTATGPVTAVAAPAAPAREAVAAPLPVTRGAEPARFFPVPARSAGISGREVPQVTVPISSSGTRSPVPITGRTAAAQAPVAVAEPAPPAAEGASAAWFGSAMKAGLDKYEQAARLNRRGQPNEPVSIQ
ncbi:MAG: hypothetical protein AB1918_04530 [Pseudomonadota bacterium]